MIHKEHLVEKKITMVVNSCDAYKDVWPLFFCALEEYWPDREFNIVLNAEAEEPDNKAEGLTVHKFSQNKGGDDWGKRFINTLESVNTEYVVMVYDDFILEDTVDNESFKKLVDFMDENNTVAVCYLKTVCTFIDGYKEQKGLRLLNGRVDYRLNSAPALWRRKDLLKYIGSNDTPWAWEVFGTYRTFDDGKEFYCMGADDDDIYKHKWRKGGAIYRGKWVEEVVVEKNRKYNLNIDFSKRGFSDNNSFEKRSFFWKLSFIWLGFRMIGFKVFYFVTRSLKAKMNAR